MKHRKIFTSRRREKWGLCPIATRLLLIGEMLMFAAIFDFAARLNLAYLADSAGAFLRLSEFGGAMSASAVILCAAALGIDYWDKTGREE